MGVYLCKLQEIQKETLSFEYMAKELPVITENNDRVIVQTDEGYNLSVGRHKFFPRNKRAVLKPLQSLYVAGDENIALSLQRIVQQEIEALEEKERAIMNDPFKFEAEIYNLIPDLARPMKQLNENQLQFVEITYSRTTGYRVNMDLISGQYEGSVFKVNKGFSPKNEIEVSEIGRVLPREELYEVTFFMGNGMFFDHISMDIVGRMLEDQHKEYNEIKERKQALRTNVRIVRLEEDIQDELMATEPPLH